MHDTHPLHHGGHILALARAAGRDPADILDFSASITPLGPPDSLRRIISRTVSELLHYPDPDCTGLIDAASRRYGAPPDELAAGNGTSDLLFALARAARGLAGTSRGPAWTRAVLAAPCYVDYRRACELVGIDTTAVLSAPDDGFAMDWEALVAGLPRQPALVFFGRPQNPTGRFFPDAPLRALAASRPDCLFVVDEAFADFVPDAVSLTRDRPDNVVVLLSLTKSFAVPGLRLGLLAAAPGIAARVRDQLAPWSVNAMAQAVGEAFLEDAAHLSRTRTEVARLRAGLAESLAGLPGVRVFPSEANFLLCRLDSGPDAAVRLRDRLLADFGVAIRECSGFEGLDGRYFRVAVRPEADNARLVTAMAAVLAPERPRLKRPRRPPAVMFQGATSNAGKSVLAAALCRILRQDGYAVAPFKAQNMSLNSGVTPDGLEMGRAQILQARACGLAPEAVMNPVLLKPSSETGSQVVLMGRPVGNMDARTYFARKRDFFATVTAAYDDLAARHEVMVLEGAGSPAEVNLMAHDIVNMAMAAHSGAGVLLVADIDRGGAFAALAGTMELLPERDRARVAGYVLNRFRGDPGLLGDAPDFLFRMTGRAVLGVVPDIAGLGLPEEDSVSLKAGGMFPSRAGAAVDLAVIDLPHISNFTDCDALAAEPDTGLRLARAPGDLAGPLRPDALILPGSKNTLADLDWLRKTGLDRAILELAETGRCEVVGICAGFQMLGDTVADPLGLESTTRHAPGLGLLPLCTELLAEKTLRLVRAVHGPTGLEVRGYEIHHGTTVPAGSGGKSLRIVLEREDGTPVGYARADHAVWGGYLHGLFDADAFRRMWLDGLRARKGLPPLQTPAPYDLEPALDRLADVVRTALDMKAVRALLDIR